ncbi:hypothetical protein [Streptomyces sp. NPDC020298]|uniref:hypothetical protein n=1 Tax=unclassified Streptomyces TaxID=2593676 RepID=UPI0033E8AD9F
MKTRYIEVPRRRRIRRYQRCRCPRNRSPLVDTLHAPLARYGFTALALLALVAHQAWPFLITTGLAIWAWRHR